MLVWRMWCRWPRRRRILEAGNEWVEHGHVAAGDQKRRSVTRQIRGDLSLGRVTVTSSVIPEIHDISIFDFLSIRFLAHKETTQRKMHKDRPSRYLFRGWTSRLIHVIDLTIK